MKEVSESNTKQLLLRLRDQRDSAAEDVFFDYVERLTALVRSRMANRLARKFDPEDVVQSAFRSFFVAARNGRLKPDDADSLWRILVTFILRKLNRRIEKFSAAKRSIALEVAENRIIVDPASMAEHAVILADEIEHLLRSQTKRDRKMIELRLQGHSQKQIAEDLGISERTVRRTLETVRSNYQSEKISPIKPMARIIETENVVSLNFPANLPTVSLDDLILKRHIGSGGSGKVYYAEFKRTGTPVAVKFLRKRFLANHEAVKRFIDEAIILAQLRHPNIVSFKAVGPQAGTGLFFVMEWVDGRPIDQFLTPGEPNLRQLFPIVQQIIDGLKEAHRTGIVHCDLKPANLLIDSQGQVKITDFGLSKRFAEVPCSMNSAAGTIAFMAPEQITDAWGTISTKTDVYGLGATIYYLITGQYIGGGLSIPEMVAHRISPESTKLPSQLNTSDAFPGILQSCLEKESKLRPTIDELIEVINFHFKPHSQ